MGIRNRQADLTPARRVTSTYRHLRRDHQERARRRACSSPSGAPTAATATAASRCGTRGGGAKRMLRQVDFRREKLGIPAKVAAIEYDPNRSARIALLHYRDGEKRYIIAPHGLKVGDTVMSGPQADILPGNALPIRNIPARHARAQRRAAAGQGRRSCAAARAPQAQLLAKEGDHATSSCPRARCGWSSSTCMATDRPGRQPRPRERVDRQGGAGALEGLPPDGARHGR